MRVVVYTIRPLKAEHSEIRILKSLHNILFSFYFLKDKNIKSRYRVKINDELLRQILTFDFFFYNFKVSPVACEKSWFLHVPVSSSHNRVMFL